ncbi:shufflon system plasmid conjugative transfer pilus tip adhesin PilV [Serratia symbiotica]|uniref:Type IV pilus protein n=2 Tax=Serratia symbiotica TaxID=138074 RepID=A0A455VIZ3_9GAMM|nr:shufflon system plasmid conjugative transfer pilus tip adhesin PilV [Serratia symbiotica]BBI93043.1 type IV pilus protein [Serratia symbiotica]
MKKTIKKKKPEVHGGFVSLEIMGALVVVALAALFGAEKYSDYLDEQGWVVAARHASQFNEASKQYIADHRDELLNQPLPKRITPAMLIKTGYLQRGFAEKNGFGQQYVTGVVKNSAKGQPALQALTCSVQGDTLPEKGMRRIAAQINGMGGYVDEKNIATGAYGGWKSQPRDFGLDCRHGHIAIALSSEILGSVLQESDRLYRFQVKHKPELNRMHTAIDMGGHNLNNANTVNAKKGHYSEEINAGGNIKTQGGWLITQHGKGWLNEAHGGGFYMNDNDWIRSVNNKGIYTGGQLKGGTVRADGRLSVGEFLQLDGTAQPGWGCSPNGLVGRTPEGALLSCQNGQWRAISPNLQIVRAETTAYRWPHATARCPAGKKLVGGGGNCRSLGPPGMGWAVLVGSQPMNETDWGVQCDTPKRQNLMAESWAICQ